MSKNKSSFENWCIGLCKDPPYCRAFYGNKSDVRNLLERRNLSDQVQYLMTWPEACDVLEAYVNYLMEELECNDRNDSNGDEEKEDDEEEQVEKLGILITGLSYPDDPLDLGYTHGATRNNIMSTSNSGIDKDNDENKEDDGKSGIKKEDKDNIWSKDKF